MEQLKWYDRSDLVRVTRFKMNSPVVHQLDREQAYRVYRETLEERGLLILKNITCPGTHFDITVSSLSLESVDGRYKEQIEFSVGLNILPRFEVSLVGNGLPGETGFSIIIRPGLEILWCYVPRMNLLAEALQGPLLQCLPSHWNNESKMQFLYQLLVSALVQKPVEFV